jgi:predicted esterase
LIDTLDALRAHADDAAGRAGIGLDEVAAIGYSQGAAVALTLAFAATAGWRPRVVVGLASWLPNEPGLSWDVESAAAAGTQVLLVHGEDDEVVPIVQGQSVRRFLERAGVEVTWVPLATGHELRGLTPPVRGWLATR